jgi:regulator of replication initiation timing
METIFFWLIAGATIALLGVFLIASERELKNKRQELEALKSKTPATGTQDNAIGSSPVYPLDNEISTELVAKNEALLQEVSSLSKQIEENESNLEQIKTLRAHLNSMETENSELLAECERLRSEISTITTKMEFNTLPPGDAEETGQNDSQIAELKEQLETSQAKIRDLESIREPLAVAESQQTAFEELQRSHEVSTLQLQNALAAEQEKQRALEAVQMQLSGIEQGYHELKEKNLQLQQENSQLLEGLSQNQQQTERSSVFRQRFQDLQLKHREIVEQERLVHEEIVAMTRFFDIASEDASSPQSLNVIRYDQSFEVKPDEPVAAHGGDFVEQNTHRDGDLELPPSNNVSDEADEVSPQLHHNSMSLPLAITAGASEIKDYAQQGMERKKRRFGIFPAAVAVVVVGGALTAGFLGEDSEQRHETNQSPYQANLDPNFPSKQSNLVREDSGHQLVSLDNNRIRVGDKATPSTEKNFQDLPVESRLTKTPGTATTAATASGKPFPVTWESYEVIQPTRVFSAPREDSQLVAKVEPGTRVNVVDSRNGWLEIRSKHGRPPGFIPRTAATRIVQK